MYYVIDYRYKMSQFSTNSKSFCYSNASTSTKPKLSSKDEIEKIWSDFMTAFNYSKYYTPSPNINNSYCYSTPTKSQAINQLNEFFTSNSIYIKTKECLYSNTSKRLLSDAKIWIMFIVISNHLSKGKSNKETAIKVCQIFKNALQNRCEPISLFEFFLIYISELSEDIIYEILEGGIPEEFVAIYKENRELLRDIFKTKECVDNAIFSFSTVKDGQNEITDIPTDFTCDIDSYLKNDTDLLNNYTLVAKDYLFKGIFMLIKNNTILSEDTPEYIIIPLKGEFEYEEKKEVGNLLRQLNESEYANYEYYPYKMKSLFEGFFI